MLRQSNKKTKIKSMSRFDLKTEVQVKLERFTCIIFYFNLIFHEKKQLNGFSKSKYKIPCHNFLPYSFD